jgi:hypothetical protein
MDATESELKMVGSKLRIAYFLPVAIDDGEGLHTSGRVSTNWTGREAARRRPALSPEHQPQPWKSRRSDRSRTECRFLEILVIIDSAPPRGLVRLTNVVVIDALGSSTAQIGRTESYAVLERCNSIDDEY